MIRYSQNHHVCTACLCKLLTALSHTIRPAVLLQTIIVHLACILSRQRLHCRLPAGVAWLTIAPVRCRPKLRHARPLPRP